MPNGDRVVETVDPARAPRAMELLPGMDAVAAKPVLFLHIPKTGGTSFLLTLRNTFGDNRVLRIRGVDDRIGETVDLIMEGGLSEISCLAGHLSLHLFAGVLDRFRAFTVLREPVARVLSLYRFMRDGDAAEPRRLGLRPGFSLAEFLNWGHPEVYSQVNNGMVRMLCGDSQMVYPGNEFLWDISNDLDTLQRALTNLKRIDFGLTEELPATLSLAQERWAVPYRLGEYHENTTTRGATGDDLALIHRIIALNTADLALYHQATALFQARLQQQPLPGATLQSDWDKLSVFTPSMNRETAIGDVPGRTGFHDFETDGLAWLHAGQLAQIHFVMGQDLVRFRLRIYCITQCYPAAEIAISVNDQHVQNQVLSGGDKWYWLETEHFETQDGLNRIAIKAPRFVRVTELDPDSKDERRLGIALSHVQIGP